MNKEAMVEWQLVSDHYGNRVAARSGIPLINHINEGLDILEELEASYDAKAAYCLHPLLQNDDDFIKNLDKVSSLVSAKIIALAVEYRRAANAYLCRPHTDHFTNHDITLVVGKTVPEVVHMLLADKKQNQKDFLLYHLGSHDRSDELNKYFQNWIGWLNDLQTVS